LIFTLASALEADTSFFKISLSSSIFEEGGFYWKKDSGRWLMIQEPILP
jgi:hypothetical protein